MKMFKRLQRQLFKRDSAREKAVVDRLVNNDAHLLPSLPGPGEDESATYEFLNPNSTNYEFAQSLAAELKRKYDFSDLLFYSYFYF